jgi:hypothetical protein
MNEPAPAPVAPSVVAEIERIERDAWADIYAAAPNDIRQALGISHQAVDDGLLLICRALDHIQFDRLGGLGVASPARAEALDQAIAAFDAAGVKNWVVHVAANATALDWLCAARGLTAHPRTWAKFVRGAEPATTRNDLVVREIGRDEADAFGATAASAFGLPSIVGRWLSVLPGRPRWQCFMAFDGNDPMTAGALYLDGRTAWLGVGGTIASRRGRGGQSAVLAARINAARAAGCSLLTTETGIPQPGEAAPSYGNIQRAGFRVAYPRPNLRRA